MKDCLEMTLKDISETEKFGKLLGAVVSAGDIICLDGDLGAGKTTLAQGVGKGLAIPESVYINSPSFALLHEYCGGRLVFYHMDFYRLYESQDVIDNGLDEYMYLQGVTIIEWAERAKDIIPATRLDIFLKVEENMTRTAFISYDQRYWQKRIDLILQAMKEE